MKLSPTEQRMLLQHLPHTGVAAYWRLLDHFPDISSALAAPAAHLKSLLADDAANCLADVLRAGDAHPLVRKVKNDIAWLQERNISIINVDDDQYPALLREIKRAPPLLYVWGDPCVLHLPQVAVIGSRSPSAGGRNNAQHFTEGLSTAGFTITSGLALGVDVVAHQASLSSGGTTLAVLGTGIDQIYPARHVKIAEQIVACGGAVVTEFPIGTNPLPANFPQRNRIISGLSCGVLVIEAAIKSGSLITARYAVQQNREVFAVPGSIQNPLSRGCHALIKDGAKLVECPNDIIEELQSILAFKKTEVTQHTIPQVMVPSDQERSILNQIGFDPVPFDDIAANTQLPAGELTAGLMTLELMGLIANYGHGYARIRS